MSTGEVLSSGRVAVGVLDHGSGNLHSACRALEAAGARVVLSSSHRELQACDKLLLPGVGAFAACMQGLLAVGGDELVLGWIEAQRPLLGICVGHQVLFGSGVEHGVTTAGLGVYGGVVEQLTSARLPHMGWNTIDEGPLAGEERYYFVHSYGVHRLEDAIIPAAEVECSFTEHDGDRFVAATRSGAVSSTQFHPEKSGRAGARLLQEWIRA